MQFDSETFWSYAILGGATLGVAMYWLFPREFLAFTSAVLNWLEFGVQQ